MTIRLQGGWSNQRTDATVSLGWLLLGGYLGMLDTLNWSPVFLSPLTQVLSHPVVSVGVLLCSGCGLVARHRQLEENPTTVASCRGRSLP